MLLKRKLCLSVAFISGICTINPSISLAQAGGKASANMVSNDKLYTLTFDMETRFITWQSNIGFPGNALAPGQTSSGTQVYTPIAAGLTYTPDALWRFELTARGGFANNYQSSPTVFAPQQTGGYGSLLDTAVGLRTSYAGIAGFVPFWAINMNLPTGRTILNGSNRFARLDPDIADISTFGAGFNIGQVFGANIAVSANQLLTVSVGHTYNGAFQRDNYDFVALADIVESFKPSNSYSANIGYMHALGATIFNASAFAIYNDASYINGTLFFKAGTSFGINAGVTHRWSDVTSTSLNLGWSYTTNNYMQDGGGGLAVEALNSNSAAYTAALTQNYYMDAWSFGLGAGFLYRDRNSYDPVHVAFSAAKTKFNINASAGYSLSDRSRLSARVEHFWINADPTAARTVPFAIPATPAYWTNGWKFSLGGSIEF